MLGVPGHVTNKLQLCTNKLRECSMGTLHMRQMYLRSDALADVLTDALAARCSAHDATS